MTEGVSGPILVRMDGTTWRKCSACKSEIGLSSRYYVCSVSTCNAVRTNYVFCSVPCFERHLPGARHRDAGAIEKTSPGAASAEPGGAAGDAGGAKRVIAASVARPGAPAVPREILVVASKVKDYIRARAGMNTSDGIMASLSDRIRELCDEAIDSARQEGRKTVLDRDVKKK